jgi:N-acetylglutamate synthase-like GNAT family acetyltransferase
MANGQDKKRSTRKEPEGKDSGCMVIQMLIRDFQAADVEEIVEILQLNDQYRFPKVDGPEAMNRVGACSAAVFLVCEVDSKVVGVIRGNYDGSRAVIHQLSVHPAFQGRGLGATLVREIVSRFKQMGAPTVSAMISERSLPFWQKVGFRKTDVFLVGNW